MSKTSARAIRLRTLGQSYKKTLIAPNEFCFLVKKYENLPPIKHFKEFFIIFATQKKYDNYSGIYILILF